MALVIRNLLDIRAVWIHYMKNERHLVPVFVQGSELWFTLINQNTVRASLASR